MRNSSLLLALSVCIFAGCSPRPQETEDAPSACVVGVVASHDEDVYAEWGQTEDGEEFEHRFAAARVRYANPEGEKEVCIVKMWFDRQAPELPKVGAEVRIPKERLADHHVPIETPNIYITDLPDFESVDPE